MAKRTITTIAKKGNKCVIYNDDGMFCTWTKTQRFDFETIQKVKNEAEDLVMLVSEEEAQAFAGEHMTIENHNAWVISKDILWILEGRFEANEREAELVEFIKEHLI